MKEDTYQNAKVVNNFTPRTKTYHPISPSGFKLFEKCPLHYWEKYINPSHVEVVKKTKNLNYGSAFHAYQDSEKSFHANFVVAPICDKRTSEGKRIFAEFELMSYGKNIISQEEYEALKATSRSILNDPRSWYLKGENALTEIKFETIKPEYEGVYIRGILDRITQHESIGKVIIEYKTCADASPYGVMKACRDYGYYNAANIYLRAFLEVEMVLFVFVETAPPYLWQIYSVERNSEVFAALNAYVSNKFTALHNCLITDVWPRYELEEIKPLPLHNYYGK